MSFILIGNNLLNASPYDGEKFKLRSVKERHSEYPETVASSLIIYSCLRMSGCTRSVASQATHSPDALFHFLQVRTMLRSGHELHARFSGASFPPPVVLRCGAGLDFEQLRFSLVFFCALEATVSFCLIIIGFLHSTSVRIRHGFLPVRCG